MIHLTESLLNEYLDDALQPPDRSRIEAHLAACPECRSELNELIEVKRILAGLQEIPLARDLTQPVLKRLHKQVEGSSWKLLLGTQFGIALGLITYLAITSLSILNVHLQNLVRSILSLPTLVQNDVLRIIPSPSADWFKPGAFPLSIPILSNHAVIWLVLGIAAALLFLVGNFSLLRGKRREIHK